MSSSVLKEDRFGDFISAVFWSFISAIIPALIFLVITLIWGFTFRSIIVLSLIAGLFTYWLTTEGMSFWAFLGCGPGSAFVTFIIFWLGAGLYQGLVSGAINIVTIYLTSFCIRGFFSTKQICQNFWHK